MITFHRGKFYRFRLQLSCTMILSLTFAIGEIFMFTRNRYNIFLVLLFMLFIPLVTVHADGITVTAQVQATLRAGPGRQFAALGGVAANVTIPALGRSADNAWVQVNASGKIGWLSKVQVTVTGDFNALPVTGGQSAAPLAGATPTARPRSPVNAPIPTKLNTHTVRITGPQIYSWLVVGMIASSVTIATNQVVVVDKGTLDGVPKLFTDFLSVTVSYGKLVATESTVSYDGQYIPAADFAAEGLDFVNVQVTNALNRAFVSLVGHRTIVGFEMNTGYMTVIYQ